MTNGGLVRHVAVVGALHHGKTSVMDMLVEQVGGWEGWFLGGCWRGWFGEGSGGF